MKVVLQKPHTHAGKRLEPGPADLPADAVAWLRAHTDVLKPSKADAPAPVLAPEAGTDFGD